MQSEAGSLRVQLDSEVIEIAWNDRALLTRIGLERGPAGDAMPDWIPARVLRFLDDLRDYFRHGAPFSRTTWDDVAAEQWTEFQRKVYRSTLSIPHGETRTYGWVAAKIGTPLACRAVGQALRKNPVPLLVPCHRVVSHQSLGGFMGEDHPDARELGLKRRLLDLENRFINPTFPFQESCRLGA